WIEKLDEEMRESNCHILLILNGAPSHITGSLNLTNIKVLMLPPHATSKIQPMDAGIIASFKLHYRYLQLQHAIDHDEDREKDIYKQQIDILPVRNPLSIEDLLNLKEEREAHHQFTDEDLIQAMTEVEQVEKEFVIPSLTGEEQLNILH
ncbi:793_t:CDS:2, partial [Racocetra persica]